MSDFLGDYEEWLVKSDCAHVSGTAIINNGHVSLTLNIRILKGSSSDLLDRIQRAVLSCDKSEDSPNDWISRLLNGPEGVV